jgi:hypothetical protein
VNSKERSDWIIPSICCGPAKRKRGYSSLIELVLDGKALFLRFKGKIIRASLILLSLQLRVESLDL